jgi:hypothetical protein
MKHLDAAMEFKFFMWIMGLFTAGIFLIWGFKMALIIGVGLKHWFTALPGIEQIIKLVELIGK